MVHEIINNENVTLIESERAMGGSEEEGSEVERGMLGS